MKRTDMASFREVLRAKQAKLSRNWRGLESIAIERSADALEEAQSKSAGELTIAGLNRQSMMRRNIATAHLRIQGQALGTCAHCGNDISRRRLEVKPWTLLCVSCQEAADRGEDSVLESLEPMFPDAA